MQTLIWRDLTGVGHGLDLVRSLLALPFYGQMTAIFAVYIEPDDVFPKQCSVWQNVLVDECNM